MVSKHLCIPDYLGSEKVIVMYHCIWCYEMLSYWGLIEVQGDKKSHDPQ